MDKTAKLLGLLNRVFDKTPDEALAFRLRYDGQMTWEVKNRVLSTTVAGGTGVSLSVDLSDYTITTLADYLGGQTGYSVLSENADLGSRMAIALMDEDGDQGASNGDHVHAFTADLWAYMEELASVLKEAEEQLQNMLSQMNMREAEDEWLEEWGSYFNVIRLNSETDSELQARIPEEAFRSRGNNRAIEEAIERVTGYKVQVVDLDWKDTDILHANTARELNGSFVAGPINPNSAKREFLRTLGFVDFSGPGGSPFWGDPANGNPLVCAFGVIIGEEDINLVGDRERTLIKSVVSSFRVAGTIELYFTPIGLLHSNTVGETLNDSSFVMGPKAGAYTQTNL